MTNNNSYVTLVIKPSDVLSCLFKTFIVIYAGQRFHTIVGSHINRTHKKRNNCFVRLESIDD